MLAEKTKRGKPHVKLGKTDENPLLWKREVVSWARICQRNWDSGWEPNVSAFLLGSQKRNPTNMADWPAH